MSNPPLIIRQFHKQVPYEASWQAMQSFTAERTPETADELWLLEHGQVFTLGQAGKLEHLLNPHAIPVIHVDRGGQITYHGPGQLMAYTMIDLRRKKLTVHELVHGLEAIVINVLKTLGVEAAARADAPGIYTGDKKIGSIGLRIRRGCSYHGLAFNINMDLTPFSYINPCGFKNLQMSQVADFQPEITVPQFMPIFAEHFCQFMRYTNAKVITADSL